MSEQICPNPECDKTFLPRQNGGKPQIYCSRKCHLHHRYMIYKLEGKRKERRTKTCLTCGCTLPARRWLFCSSKCQGKSYRLKLGIRPIAKQLQCSQCGGSLAHKSDRARFCSNSCKIRFHNKLVALGHNIPINCKQCGMEFIRKSSIQKFCSKRCRRRNDWVSGRVAETNKRNEIKRAKAKIALQILTEMGVDI